MAQKSPFRLSFSTVSYNGKGGRWKYKKKDSNKYHEPPRPPVGAFCRECDGFQIWTLSELSDAELLS